MRLRRTALLKAERAGREAGAAGRNVVACPYDVDADTLEERAQAKMWLTGWTATRKRATQAGQ